MKAAKRTELSHASLLQLLEVNAARGNWRRIEKWLPILAASGVALEERQGSAIALADWLQQRRRPALASILLDQVNWDSADAPAWLVRGHVALSLGQVDAAERYLIRAQSLYGGDVNSAYRLGQLYRAKGNFDQASFWFLGALNLDHQAMHIHKELQFTRVSDDLLPDLVTFYSKLCNRYPHRALLGQLHSNYLMLSGNSSAAIYESRRAARLELGSRIDRLEDHRAEPTPPDFLVAGVPKGGTTSVFSWLSQIQGLWCHPRKELNFFNDHYMNGEAWYCAQFPRFKDEGINSILRGEASPGYFNHPEAAQRIASTMPKAKVIILLRNPLARALSWVQHLQRLEGLQGNPSQWLEWELNQLESLNKRKLTPATRIGTGAIQDSCYDYHYARWTKSFNSSQLLLLSSENLFSAPTTSLSTIMNFLGLPDGPQPWTGEWKTRNANPRKSITIESSLKSRLNGFLNIRNKIYFDLFDRN